jgi:hypothetical protein
MGGIVSVVLLFLLSGVVKPKVNGLFRWPIFPPSDAADDDAVVRAALMTAGVRWAGGRYGGPLAAVALEDDPPRMPLVAPAEGNLVRLVVCFSVFDDPRHSLTPSRRPTRPLKARESPRDAAVVCVNEPTLVRVILDKG